MSNDRFTWRNVKFNWSLVTATAVLALLFAGPKLLEVPADALIRKGNYYFNGGAYDLPKAVRYYRAALFLKPDNFLARYQLSRIYFINGKFDAAMTEIVKTISIRPDYGKAYYMKGLIDGYTNKLDAAEADFKQVLDIGKLDAGGWAVFSDLSWIQFRMGHYEDVEQTALRGLVLYPNNPWLLNSLGLAMMNLNKKSEAKIAFERALARATELTPEDVARAYPGNNPEEAAEHRIEIIQMIQFNLKLSTSASPL